MCRGYFKESGKHYGSGFGRQNSVKHIGQRRSRNSQIPHRKRNIKFVLNAKVEEFINSNEALLDSGEKVEFDVLVVAVGVIPNTGLIKDINGKVNRGIVVDEFCQTPYRIYMQQETAVSPLI